MNRKIRVSVDGEGWPVWLFFFSFSVAIFIVGLLYLVALICEL